jgi:hypothetical protein
MTSSGTQRTLSGQLFDTMGRQRRFELCITGKIGSGASGHVFVAKNAEVEPSPGVLREQQQKAFALKRFSLVREQETFFARELHFNQTLVQRGAHVLPVTSVFVEHDNRHVSFILPYARCSLDHFEPGIGECGVASTLDVAQKLCRAVLSFHTRGYAHGDLKPHNAVVYNAKEGDCRVALIDVSYATNLYSDVGAAQYGTSLFAAADIEYENTTLETTPSAVVDCYALGITLMSIAPTEYRVDVAGACVGTPVSRWPSTVEVQVRRFVTGCTEAGADARMACYAEAVRGLTSRAWRSRRSCAWALRILRGGSPATHAAQFYKGSTTAGAFYDRQNWDAEWDAARRDVIVLQSSAGLKRLNRLSDVDTVVRTLGKRARIDDETTLRYVAKTCTDAFCCTPKAAIAQSDVCRRLRWNLRTALVPKNRAWFLKVYESITKHDTGYSAISPSTPQHVSVCV